MMKTTLSNVESLRQPGALFALLGQLPRVLQDAMDVTRYLEECYLWCDALCIVQDDADFKHSQIALMGHICFHMRHVHGHSRRDYYREDACFLPRPTSIFKTLTKRCLAVTHSVGLFQALN